MLARAASRLYEHTEGEILVVDLLEVVLDFCCCLIGYAYCHLFSALLVPKPLFNLEGTLMLLVRHSSTCSPSLSNHSPSLRVRLRARDPRTLPFCHQVECGHGLV